MELGPLKEIIECPGVPVPQKMDPLPLPLPAPAAPEQVPA